MYPSRVVDLRSPADDWETREQPESHQLVLFGWRRWFGKGVWAISDRGLFSLSNFAINIVLARWLSPHDYGAFALAYAIFLLLGAIYTSFLTDPMLVFGPGTYRHRLPAYLGVLLQAHWAFAGAASLVLLAGALGIMLTGRSALAATIAAMAFASPFILLQWLLRLACYVRLEPHRAAYAGALYMAFVAVGLYGLHYLGWLSPASSMGLMALASLGSVMKMIPGPGVLRRRAQDPQLFHAVIADHWSYCRWIVGANGMAAIPQGICYLLLPAWGGLEAAGALKALLNLIMPVLHTYWALAGVLVPVLVRARRQGAFGQIVRVVLVSWLSGALLYWVLLGRFHLEVIHGLYDGRYDAYASLLWIVALIPILFAGELIFNSVLRAHERPDQIFWASALSSVTALTVGVALIFTWGLRGAVVGLLCAAIVDLAAMAWQCRTHFVHAASVNQ